MNFDLAFDKLMRHEGGFSDHRQDTGGKTRFGITEAVARANGYTGDMRDLPIDKARAIARSEYWNAVRADQLPELLRYPVFDAAYNSGPVQAIKWLQRALGVADDGKIGPVTLGSANSHDPYKTLNRMSAARLDFLAGLTSWPAFGRGWVRRVAATMREA